MAAAGRKRTKDEQILRNWYESPARMVRELFGATPDAWQQEALDAFRASPRMAMAACAGPGKAQPVNLMIDTPSGRRRFGDLRPGDFVFAPDGMPTRVKRVHPRGILPMYRVAFDDGSETVACGEHLWRVRGRTERRHFKAYQNGTWTKASEKQCIDKGFMPTPRDGYSILTTEQIIARNDCLDGKRRQFEIPRQEAVFFPPSEMPVDPYVLGLWLGDGAKNTSRCSWKDWELDREVERRGFRVKRSKCGRAVTLYGLKEALTRLGVAHLGSHERYIPDTYKYAPIACRMDTLRGLMDTDGTIAADRSMSFDVTSERLASDVEWLVRSLGGVAIRRRAKKTHYRHPVTREKISGRLCYRVTVTTPFCPFLLPRKAARWRKPQERYLTRYIDRIEATAPADAMCIEVEHPSRCYLTNDFIVTHNSTVLAWLGWNFLLTRPHPWIGVTSITGDNLKSGLWTELARWYQKSEFLRQQFEFQKEQIFLKEHPATWKMEARKWAKDADDHAIGNALRGPHAKYIMWLLDETGDMPNSIMPVCENIFAGNPKEAHIVQAGNPTQLGGPLHRACHSDLWKVIRITADPDDPKRTPRVSIEHARQMIAQARMGREDPYIMVNILGQFPPSNFNSLIGADEVRASMSRMYREYELTGSPRVLGIDVAREGDDQSVIAKRRGLQMFPLIKHRNLDGNQGASITAREWQEFMADACFIDATGGFGASWIDNLTRLGRQPIGVQFSSSAIQDARYANKRAEMAMELVDWIRRGGALPHDERLLAALTQTTYTFRGDRLLIQPKEQVKAALGYSPDEFDACMLTVAAPVQAAQVRTGRRPASAVSGNYDPFGGMETPVPGGFW